MKIVGRKARAALGAAAVILAGLVLLAGHGAFDRAKSPRKLSEAPPAASLPQQGGTYQVLDSSLQALRQQFNRDAGRPRVLMLLSPT